MTGHMKKKKKNQARKGERSYNCVFGVSILTLSMIFLLELFQQCGIFCFSFMYSRCAEYKSEYNIYDVEKTWRYTRTDVKNIHYRNEVVSMPSILAKYVFIQLNPM